MPNNEEKGYVIKITCSHCNHVNEVVYSDFRSAMLGNHFFKLQCQKEDCNQRTLVTYALFTMPYTQGEVPEKVFQRITIPQGSQTKKEKEI